MAEEDLQGLLYRINQKVAESRRLASQAYEVANATRQIARRMKVKPRAKSTCPTCGQPLALVTYASEVLVTG